MLKERGAEKSGYRGCLVGSLVGGVPGAYIALHLTQNSVREVQGFGASMFSVMYGSLGFIVGMVVGVLVVFVIDLFTRKREEDIDAF